MALHRGRLSPPIRAHGKTIPEQKPLLKNRFVIAGSVLSFALLLYFVSAWIYFYSTKTQLYDLYITGTAVLSRV